MWQVMNLAPGLRVSGADVGGTAVGTQQNYANYGTSSGGNKPTIDGVDTREDATGAGFYYDYGAFQEVQIKAMGNDAEMSTPGTAVHGHPEVGRRPVPRVGLLRLGDAAASRPTTSPTSCGREA